VVSTDIATVGLFPENAKPYIGKIDLAIDHHPSFESFGKENIVRPEAAACGELMYDILANLGPITPEIALPLYVAVSTDTGCFAYNNTSAQTHAVAAALIRTGIDFKTVNKVFFRTKTRKRMQLEGAMLDTMEFFDRDRVAILSVPISLMERVQATETDAEDLSALGGQIEGVDCAVTMRELRPDVWKMSVRTGARINATNVCRVLGGGGHAAAAGCTIMATWPEAKRQILDAIRQHAEDFSE
jgi:phosphoesterase RecJ-like protein